MYSTAEMETAGIYASAHIGQCIQSGYVSGSSGGSLLALTKKYDIDPAYLHLEITESAYTESPDQIISTVTELCKLGFIVEMDDFGSGYSSLNMLSQMPLDILKLDMKFIQSEMAKPVEQSILNDIITMAHRMRLDVVAEGVETREQMKRLQDIGCDYVQGYYFAKPMPVAEFEELWTTQQVCTCGKAPKEQTTQTIMQSLLVVDEDAQYREKTRQFFEGEYPIVEASDANSALACLKSEEADNISALIVSLTLPDNGAAVLLRALRQDPAFWELPVLAVLPGGEKLKELPLAFETDDFICKWHPMFDLKKRVQRLMDIANAHQRELALQEEAGRDHLTGLFNRRGLQAAMASIQKEEMPLALFLFDLDNLKMVNDTYGHEFGDRMLQAFAELLQSNTRPGDILCRYGGDEFMVILKCVYDGDSVIKKGMEICQKFENHLEDAPVRCSCSVGIALCGADEKPSPELIEHADRALYRAKRENKGGCCLWNEGEKQAETQTNCNCRANRGKLR